MFTHLDPAEREIEPQGNKHITMGAVVTFPKQSLNQHSTHRCLCCKMSKKVYLFVLKPSSDPSLMGICSWSQLHCFSKRISPNSDRIYLQITRAVNKPTRIHIYRLYLLYIISKSSSKIFEASNSRWILTAAFVQLWRCCPHTFALVTLAATARTMTIILSLFIIIRFIAIFSQFMFSVITQHWYHSSKWISSSSLILLQVRSSISF